MIYDMIIVGGGPAGLTAALYCARAGKKVLVLEKEAFGGQIVYSPLVDNYPACPHINGMELGNRLTSQAMEAGAELESAEVTGVICRENQSFTVESDVGSYEGKTLILATGARHRRLGLPREEEFLGRGVSYCAICDGAFYTGKKVGVVGGGNTAFTNALFLADRCREVVIIHFLENFQAEEKLCLEVMARPNVSALMLKDTREIVTESGEFRGLKIMDRVTGLFQEVALDGVFISVGQEPQSIPFSLMGITDEDGYYNGGEDCRTLIPGVFVAGDGRRKAVRQLATAVGDGAVAALAALEYVKK